MDDARLTNAAKETARLEAELALLGFGAADDPDGVYGTVTFAPGGPGVLAQAARAKKTPERAERTSREARRKKRAREEKEKTSSPGKRFSKSEKARRANARGASSATKYPYAAGPSGSDASGSGWVFDAEEPSPSFAPLFSLAAAERAERAEIAAAKRTAALARVARGYDADFAAPLVSRRVAAETLRREALLGSIARLAGIGCEANEEESRGTT